MVLRRIGILSCGKVMGAVYALMGLILGAFVTVFATLATAVGQQAGAPQGAMAPLFGIGAIIIAPIFYGVMGFIFGIISAAFYNLVAQSIGGLELDFEDRM
jgi:hypothetical protein